MIVWCVVQVGIGRKIVLGFGYVDWQMIEVGIFLFVQLVVDFFVGQDFVCLVNCFGNMFDFFEQVQFIVIDWGKLNDVVINDFDYMFGQVFCVG